MLQDKCYLVGHGLMDWGHVYNLASEFEALWMDFDGVQMAPFPATAPQTTHVWAWSKDRWLRVRVDGHSAIVGELSSTATGQKSEIEVSVNRFNPLLWSAKDRRIPTPTLQRLPENIAVFETITLQPIQFIEASR